MSKELPKLVLNRNFTLTTTLGHSIAFVKGEPTHVPRVCYQEALSIGALPEDGEEIDMLGEEAKNPAPTDPAERAPLIMGAAKTLVERNDRDDFTAAGAPHVDAVTKLLGFKVSKKELGLVWQQYHDEKAAEDAQ